MKQQPDSVVLELLLAEAPPDEASPRAVPMVAVGRLVGFDEAERPQVEVSGGVLQEPVPARSIIQLVESQLGREVVLAFEGGDLGKPIVMGVIQEPTRAEGFPETAGIAQPLRADIDGETLRLTAKREMVLRCGKASITLTRAGKVLIRGAYLLNRSSGVNRIKGGSVQIN